ncbi:MAG: hypothetical protein K0R65_1806 [Crocinitomicaceae bacterium]|nr:hypothetical protein [Crocinitomicaceae bacterium]
MEANAMKTDLMKTTEFNRYGVISMLILIIGCMGGITVGFGAIQYTATLVAVVVPTMLTLSLILGVAPMKWILGSAVTALLIDILLMIYFTVF